MNEEAQARLILLNSIEPGSLFWSGEVKKNGAKKVLDGIHDGFYDDGKDEILNIKDRLKSINFEGAISEISENEGQFI